MNNFCCLYLNGSTLQYMMVSQFENNNFQVHAVVNYEKAKLTTFSVIFKATHDSTIKPNSKSKLRIEREAYENEKR